MIKIKHVVPTKDYIENAHQWFTEFVQAERLDGQFELEEIIVSADKAKYLQHEDADVIISRGLMARILKKYSHPIPVVEIPVQGIDLIRTLHECREIHGRKKVAVIGARNMIYGVESLEGIIDLSIQKYIMHDLKDSAILVQQAKAEGCEVVISGYTPCKDAEAIGLATVVIETRKEAFLQAVSEATRLAVFSRMEQEKAKQYQTILDHAHEGVIAIDLKGNITVFNTAAKGILGLHGQTVIGKQVSEVLLRGELLYLLLSNADFQETIISYNAVQLSVKKIAYELKGNKVGDMVTFQDVTGIQEMESEIRKKIHLRGHVAKYHFDHIIYQDEQVEKTIATAKKYSQVDSNILIVGETGTGKEIYAQSIHNESPRKNKPFVAVNCAALPEELLESELFGYVEGAFTGARKDGKQGIFELAHRGTLFLDEIGEVSPKLQSRLLRVLQEREVMRIGDDKIIPVDVRIIAATNKDLLSLSRENNFREDLYYRLSVLNLELLPLREHPADIPLLAQYFLKEHTYSHGAITLTTDALALLKEQNWEGNVRQLENFCERLAVLFAGKTVTVAEVEDLLPKSKRSVSERKRPVNEKERLLMLLEAHQYQREKVAEALGISRTTLWRRMKKHNIETT